jgi:hypothetical protein
VKHLWWTPLFLVACSGEASLSPGDDAGLGDDTFVPASDDSGTAIDSGTILEDSAVDTTMPPTTPMLPGEKPSVDGDQTITIAAKGEAILRVESKPTEHIHFMLTFDPPSQPVVMRVDRWDSMARELGRTDAGGGLRTLAVFDGDKPATFWVRINSTAAFTGKLTITRTPFADGVKCPSDCAKLMQLPLPNNPMVDGYATTTGTVFRYQFGRRDMLMLLRWAAHRMIAFGKVPFVPEDLSQWNGETPGVDVGSPRHASHQRGKDVDVSLYGSDGKAIWRSFCTTMTTSDGRECVNGTAKDLDARGTARELAGFYEGDIVTMMFLDRELIELVAPAASPLAKEGVIDNKWVPYFSDGTHLQHWPNHDNHVHVRISEGAKSVIGIEPIEPP